MPSVENGGYYEGEPPHYVHLEKGEKIIPLTDPLSDEDLIIMAALQERIDDLKDDLESRGLSLNDLTTEHFLQTRKDDSNDHPTE